MDRGAKGKGCEGGNLQSIGSKGKGVKGGNLQSGECNVSCCPDVLLISRQGTGAQ